MPEESKGCAESAELVSSRLARPMRKALAEAAGWRRGFHGWRRFSPSLRAGRAAARWMNMDQSVMMAAA